MDEIFKLQVENITALVEHYLNTDNKRLALITDATNPFLVHSFSQRKLSLLATLKSMKNNPGSDFPGSLKIALEEFKNTNKDAQLKKNLVIMLDRKLPKDADTYLEQLNTEGVEILFIVFGDELKGKDIKDLEEKGKVLLKTESSKDDTTEGTKDILNSLEG